MGILDYQKPSDEKEKANNAVARAVDIAFRIVLVLAILLASFIVLGTIFFACC